MLLGAGLLVAGGAFYLVARPTAQPGDSPSNPASGPASEAPPTDWEALRRESARWMPDELKGVRLGITEEELRKLRPTARPDVRGERPEEPYHWLVESLGGSEVRFAVSDEAGRLVRIQVLSKLPSLPALQAHLAAMNERYGSVSGLWRCATGDGLPTLRFTWRGHRVAVADIVLIHPGGVSVTLDVAPDTLVGRSLQLGGCRPATREDLDQPLPVADPKAIQQRLQGRGPGR